MLAIPQKNVIWMAQNVGYTTQIFSCKTLNVSQGTKGRPDMPPKAKWVLPTSIHEKTLETKKLKYKVIIDPR